ncbi:MAG: ABC transporter ATP-binding protein [Spirochaetes bacterium]|uniref:ABC transporter ATP-binding protein n=1 Tax=Candidatus Gallitreponema excrementavium TaxID=2840840 RepID=A0A9D9N2Y7_9SPIR|nr:ABC transporter ATP-binding protein [Candidatus Gallitreponema excrementavium]
MKEENILLSLDNVSKLYKMGETVVTALDGVSFNVERGEFLSIMGPSGSGKSTCMNLIGCLDKPTSGEILINGKKVSLMNQNQLAEIRNRTIGFVFQQYNLLPNLSVIENVMLPLRYQGVPVAERRKRAEKVLDRMGLSDRLNHKPSELSGGQKQRTAIARATVTDPALILADEPTGALDSHTGESVMDLFNEINREGTTIIVVTHDEKIGRSLPRTIRILDGKIQEDFHA